MNTQYPLQNRALNTSIFSSSSLLHFLTSIRRRQIHGKTRCERSISTTNQLIKDKTVYELGAETHSDKQASSPSKADETKQQKEQPSNMPQTTNETKKVKVNEDNGQNTGITGVIGGLFGYFSSAVKSTAEYVGTDGHFETAKNKINETIEYYGINEAVKSTSSKVVGLGKERESTYIIKEKK